MTTFTNAVKAKMDDLQLDVVQWTGLDMLEQFTKQAGFDVESRDAMWFGIGVLVACEGRLPGVGNYDNDPIAIREYGRATVAAYRAATFPLHAYVRYVKISSQDGLLPKEVLDVAFGDKLINVMCDDIRLNYGL